MRKCVKEYNNRDPRDIRWEAVSHRMAHGGFKKNSKQCRERWNNNLDPALVREKWTLQENQKLFDLQSRLGNHWKAVSAEFPQRTDNGVKNQFFSVIRKSLRKAYKIVNNDYDPGFVSNIKPKILSDFIKLPLDGEHPGTRARDLIQKLAFSKFKKLRADISMCERKTIQTLLNTLSSLKFFN